MPCPKCGSKDLIYRDHATEQGLHGATHVGMHHANHALAANPILGMIVIGGVWAAGVIGRLFNRDWVCRDCHHSFTS